ncbi:Lipase family protein [Caballeronia sordidicola]|uniref:Lipase family protein n=1 Tax=Caballeronia sordidicola TaxID=196367 RepID=A0A226WQD6_CABSO|nr:Lipase family protein [Caballeronia sordidicola]
MCVEMARLAYIRFEESEAERTRLESSLALPDFSAITPFVDLATGTQAFGALRESDGLAVVSIRGTEPTKATDLATDLEFSLIDWTESAGRVHDGFARAARSIAAPVAAWLESISALRKTLAMTGHSLGAAVATLLATTYAADHLVTIGSPRVGDAKFIATLSSVQIHRFVDCCDVVTELPPELGGYVHAGPTMYISGTGELDATSDSTQIEEDKAAARADYLRQYAWKTGTVAIRDLADHSPINYVRAILD